MLSKIRWLAGVASALAFALPATAGSWGPARSLQGPFAVSSPPEAPLVTMNLAGHGLVAWSGPSGVRVADRLAGGGWAASVAVPGGGTSAGLVASALGNGDVAALAWTTVATRYVPSKLMVSLRAPGGAFAAPVEVAPGSGVAALRLGVACDGSVTLLWSDGGGVRTASLAGVPGASACDGVPGPGPWSAPVELALAQAGAALPDLVVNDAGAALAVWQQGAAGQPSAVLAALRPAGADWGSAEAVSTPTGHATWNPKPGLDAAGNAAVGYLDGTSMVVSRRPSGGAWSAPEVVSGSQRAYYPALALAARGDLLVAWLAYDPANTGSVWQRLAPAGAGLGNATRLSGPTENADWPSAAFAGDGSVAVVGWVDDASNVARASVWSGATWARSALGGGWWGGQVSVGAGSAAAVAGWAMPNRANPNSAQIVGRAWQ